MSNYNVIFKVKNNISLVYHSCLNNICEAAGALRSAGWFCSYHHNFYCQTYTTLHVIHRITEGKQTTTGLNRCQREEVEGCSKESCEKREAVDQKIYYRGFTFMANSPGFHERVAVCVGPDCQRAVMSLMGMTSCLPARKSTLHQLLSFSSPSPKLSLSFLFSLSCFRVPLSCANAS